MATVIHHPLAHLTLVLHAHLPFVRHPEHEEFLEQDWLYEAITESYIPLLWMLEGLVRDGIDFRLTLSLSPPLVAMLDDALLRFNDLYDMLKSDGISGDWLAALEQKDNLFPRLDYRIYADRT